MSKSVSGYSKTLKKKYKKVTWTTEPLGEGGNLSGPTIKKTSIFYVCLPLQRTEMIKEAEKGLSSGEGKVVNCDL